MKLKRYHTMGGARVTLIAEPGRIYTELVYIDSPIKVHKVANGDVATFSHDIVQGSRKVKPAARHMLKVGKKLGISKGAKKFLRAVAKGG